mmetsp:Transcript_32283/g.79247  ORF Transcript_32283/g.79247 Transcript_32283/m.79247 type:complete len:228 (+) Transcript_32283:1958-2641(+)
MMSPSLRTPTRLPYSFELSMSMLALFEQPLSRPFLCFAKMLTSPVCTMCVCSSHFVSRVDATRSPLSFCTSWHFSATRVICIMLSRSNEEWCCFSRLMTSMWSIWIWMDAIIESPARKPSQLLAVECTESMLLYLAIWSAKGMELFEGSVTLKRSTLAFSSCAQRTACMMTSSGLSAPFSSQITMTASPANFTTSPFQLSTTLQMMAMIRLIAVVKVSIPSWSRSWN